MSFVADQVHRIDAQLDRLQLTASSASASTVSASPRAVRLQALVRAVSSTTTPIRASRLRALIEQFQDQVLPSIVVDDHDDEGADSKQQDAPHDEQRLYERDLEWLVVSKAAAQAYGLILQACLGQIIGLDDDEWYWNGVLSSARWTSYYTLQTSPLRLWDWSLDVYREAQEKVRRGLSREGATVTSVDDLPLSERWQQFWGLVRETVYERGMADVRSRVMSPVTRCRNEVEGNQRNLDKLRKLGASGLGVLIDEALQFETDDDSNSDDVPAGERPSRDAATKTISSSQRPAEEEWRTIVSKSVALMETVLLNVTSLHTSVTEFEDVVFSGVDSDSEGGIGGRGVGVTGAGSDHTAPTRPAMLASKLHDILATHLPQHDSTARKLRRRYGRPSWLVRYWFPAVIGLLSTSAMLRFFFAHQASVLEWASQAGETARDFWFNWVVQPMKKIVGTIRHDEGSEIAIMSRRSLEGDRDSLERMVTEFALDQEHNMTTQQAEQIRAGVREGDLTPVLKAYERDLRRPFMGAIRGDLVRALLIQVQKTKVDVEVAIGGIDSLLKSQELVFGFIGLGPGLAVCIGLYQWLSRSCGQGGRSASRSQMRIIRVLANIDDILTSSIPGSNGMLSYKEHGLLLCEVHILRENGLRVIPAELHHDYLKHLGKLMDIKTGVEQQAKVARRIQRMWEQVILRKVYGS